MSSETQMRKAGGLVPRLPRRSSTSEKDLAATSYQETEARSSQHLNGESVETSAVPLHCQAPDQFIFRMLFSSLCFMAIGQTHLGDVWESSNADATFNASKERILQRVTAITIVTALILVATASFLTTSPPVGSIVNYNIRGAYVLLFLSFGMALGGLIVGCTIIYVVTNTGRVWFRHTLMSSRSSAWCWLISIGYPFLSICNTTILLMFGVLVGAWTASDKIAKVGGAFVLAVPASIIPVALWSQKSPRGEHSGRVMTNGSGVQAVNNEEV